MIYVKWEVEAHDRRRQNSAERESAAVTGDMDHMVEPPSELTLLIVDDDKPFLGRLGRAMEARGFTVTTADSVAEGWPPLKRTRPPSPLSI